MSALPEHGRPVQEVLADLRSRRAHDLQVDRATSRHFESGLPEIRDLVASAGALMIGTNGLDPTAYPSVPSIENDLVQATAQVHGGDHRTVGTVTSGGTESCLLAVLGARERWRGGHADPTGRPELVLPVTAHPAFRKAAHLFDLDVVDVPVDPVTFGPDPQDVAHRLTDRTALVVVSAPEYAHGTLDPVAQVAAAAAERDVLCHLDMCIGGWVVPFVRADEGHPPVDLSVPGVTSVSADLHKYGYAPKGVSVLLHADDALRRLHYFADTRWPGYPLVNATLLSSRSVGPAASAWAVLQHLGLDGMRGLALAARRGTLELMHGVAGIDGLQVVAPPAASLLAVTADEGPDAPDVWVVIDEMAARGWPLEGLPARAGGRTSFHVTMTASVAGQVPVLLAALAESVAAARARGPARPDDALVAAAATVQPDALDQATVAGLLDMAGLGAQSGTGSLLPQRMAPVNAVLEAAPPALVERLLVAVLGRVYGG